LKAGRDTTGERGHSAGKGSAHPSLLIIGLGNPILGDDGVGWRVAENVQARLAMLDAHMDLSQVQVDCLSLGGLSLMERLAGWQRAILIDMINTGNDPPGTVSTFSLDALPASSGVQHATSHDTPLAEALRIGRTLGEPLPRPEDVRVVAVEARPVTEYSEQLSPAVSAAVEQAGQMVMDIIMEWIDKEIRPPGDENHL